MNMLALTPMKDSLTTLKICTYYNNEDFIRSLVKSDFHMFHKNWMLSAHCFAQLWKGHF